MKNHRSAICTRDMDASLRFWRDGLGFAVQMDQRFEGDWPTLFGARQPALRSIFLGDPGDTTGGIVEPVKFDGGPTTDLRCRERRCPPSSSCRCASTSTSRSNSLPPFGRGGEPRRITVPPRVRMALVEDPNGMRVELVDPGPSRQRWPLRRHGSRHEAIRAWAWVATEVEQIGAACRPGQSHRAATR